MRLLSEFTNERGWLHRAWPVEGALSPFNVNERGKSLTALLVEEALSPGS